MTSRDVWWLGTDTESHEILDFSRELRGFIGSSLLIAHRPKASDSILYNYFLQRALAKKVAVFFPLKEPYHLPKPVHPVLIPSSQIHTRHHFNKGKVYRFQTSSFDADAEYFEELYKKLLESRARDYPFSIVFDTLKKWTPILEEHIRFLLRECPLVQGSIWVHCPLAIVPPDLFSAFGNVIVIWPSQHDIDLLNSHFPSEKIPLINHEKEKINNQMLVFKSKPVNERGWSWKKFMAEI